MWVVLRISKRRSRGKSHAAFCKGCGVHAMRGTGDQNNISSDPRRLSRRAHWAFRRRWPAMGRTRPTIKPAQRPAPRRRPTRPTPPRPAVTAGAPCRAQSDRPARRPRATFQPARPLRPVRAPEAALAETRRSILRKAMGQPDQPSAPRAGRSGRRESEFERRRRDRRRSFARVGAAGVWLDHHRQRQCNTEPERRRRRWRIQRRTGRERTSESITNGVSGLAPGTLTLNQSVTAGGAGGTAQVEMRLAAAPAMELQFSIRISAAQTIRAR